jgi:hypothetical protein
MAKPNKARIMSSWVNDPARPDKAEKAENARITIIRIGRRPKRSASNPKKSAPNGRAARVTKIATATDFTSVPNSTEIAFSMNTSRKKSNASSVQPR